MLIFTRSSKQSLLGHSVTKGDLHKEAFGAQILEGSCRLQFTPRVPARCLPAVLILHLGTMQRANICP